MDNRSVAFMFQLQYHESSYDGVPADRLTYMAVAYMTKIPYHYVFTARGPLSGC